MQVRCTVSGATFSVELLREGVGEGTAIERVPLADDGDISQLIPRPNAIAAEFTHESRRDLVVIGNHAHEAEALLLERPPDLRPLLWVAEQIAVADRRPRREHGHASWCKVSETVGTNGFIDQGHERLGVARPDHENRLEGPAVRERAAHPRDQCARRAQWRLARAAAIHPNDEYRLGSVYRVQSRRLIPFERQVGGDLSWYGCVLHIADRTRLGRLVAGDPERGHDSISRA